MTEVRKPGLNSFDLKVIALMCMIADHAAKSVITVPGPGRTGLLAAGRLAMPIFCFLIVEGVIYTHSLKNYAIRIGIFAVISEIPYNLVIHKAFWCPEHQNVMFSYLFLILGLWFFDWARKKNRIYLALPVLIGLAAASWFLKVDYGAQVVCMGVLLYCFRDYPWWKYILIGGLMTLTWLPRWQALAGLAFLILPFYNREKGPYISKYVFYAAYPLQFIILYLIMRFQ